MKRTLSEKRTLKKLGIPDFRHMTKDKIVEFVSMLPYMDREVAKKALEQFPAFKDLASEMVIQYRDIVERVFEENKTSQQAFYDACNNILASLSKELECESITREEREQIENKMIEVARMIGEKDSENKKFQFGVLKLVGGVCMGIMLGAFSLLGSSARVTQHNSEETGDENVDETLVD